MSSSPRYAILGGRALAALARQGDPAAKAEQRWRANRALGMVEPRPVLEQDHAEALAENAAHDAAMTKAQELTPAVLDRFADRPVQLPRALRYGRRGALRLHPAR